MPLREIINSTIECKINEELKEYTVSSKVLRDVNGQLETLQHKIDEHIEDIRDQFTVVNQDIVSLRKDTEETILHEILEHKKNLIKLVDTLKSDLDEKMNNLSSNVVFMQSGVQKKIEEHIRDNRYQFTVVKQDIATLRKEMEEKITHEILEYKKNFTKIFNTVNKNLDEKTEQLQKHSNRLRGHDSRLDDLNANVNAINSRAEQQRKLDLLETKLADAEEINDTKLQETVNLKILTELGFYEYAALFTEPPVYSNTEPLLYIHGHDNGNATIVSNSFNSKMSIIKGKIEIILKKEVFLSDGIENKGIHITSTVPITVYGFQRYQDTSDGYAAISIKYMSTKYIVASFTVWQHRSLSNCLIGIVSLGGNTKVKGQLKMKQGTVKYNGKEFANGENIQINMLAFQTLQFSHNYHLNQ
ncbi:unnamed protein product [Mytilus coruscus]|uniref:Uncharacterized protein n=1 Tax=Mytilus coruscus TaxID=42192 RepID=A0A6J8E7A2_MYTCO|nr:unnamed protein product [Mytilus coruscus]